MAEIKGVKVYINLYDKWGNSVGAIELEPRLVDGLPKNGSRKGELVLNTQDSKLYFWDGSEWKKFAIDPHAHVRADITDFFDSPFWDSIPDKPDKFPPEEHTHPRSDITDFFDSPFWDNIPDKPSEFPPEPHGHSVGDITFDGSVTPDTNNTYDLGSSSKRWRNAYFASKVTIGDAGFLGHRLTVSGDITSGIKTPDIVLDDFEWFNIGHSSGEGYIAAFIKGDSDSNSWVSTHDSARGSMMQLNIGAISFLIGTSAGKGSPANPVTVAKITSSGMLPGEDNTYDLGSSSLRWKSIYVVNTYTGDVVFQNGWKITEFDENDKLIDGLRVLNKDGVEILRITEDGLYFKGKKITG